MKKILLTLLLGSTLTAYALDNQIKISQQQIDNLDIKVAPLTVSNRIPLLYAPAKVAMPANRELLVSSTQSGLVSQLMVNIGDTIIKDQVLARVNSPELVMLQQDFLNADNEYRLSGLSQSRDKKLLNEGVIAERRWQETQSLHDSKAARLDAARQLLTIAGMSPAEINHLAHTHKLSNQLNVHAPIGGVVLERLTNVGARLDTQTPLYRIADISELWLEIDIPQERLTDVHIGDKVQVENTDITATINLLGQSVNNTNQTVSVRAVVDGKATGLRVGQNINAQIVRHSQQPGYRVATTAIAQNEGHNYIFVRNAEGFAVTEVNVIGRQGNEALVSGPLTGQEQIAEKGAVALKANWLGLGAE